jgi:hypothetical protein
MEMVSIRHPQPDQAQDEALSRMGMSLQLVCPDRTSYTVSQRDILLRPYRLQRSTNFAEICSMLELKGNCCLDVFLLYVCSTFQWFLLASGTHGRCQ